MLKTTQYRASNYLTKNYRDVIRINRLNFKHFYHFMMVKQITD